MIIPIHGGALPDSPALLREHLEAGLRGLELTPRAVVVEAPGWPQVAELKVDLSGASVAKPASFPRVEGAGAGTLAVEHLILTGQPVTVQGLPLSIELQARSAVLQMTRLTGGHHALVLHQAAAGTLELSTGRGDLERLAHTLLSGLARQHGADVVETAISFTQRGPRALSFEARVTAKVMMMKAPIAVGGDLDLDDELQLRVSHLQLTGGGMAAKLAKGFLQPQFEKLERAPISLSALALGEIRLRDVGVKVDGETLRISAKFGS